MRRIAVNFSFFPTVLTVKNYQKFIISEFLVQNNYLFRKDYFHKKGHF